MQPFLLIPLTSPKLKKKFFRVDKTVHSVYIVYMKYIQYLQIKQKDRQ